MSEVLLDFMDPLLALIDDNYHIMDKAISPAVAVWNLSLMPRRVREKGVNEILEVIGKDDP